MNWKIRTDIYTLLCIKQMGFPRGSVIKNPPSMQETQVWIFLVQEDPMEKEMATHSGILA